MRTTIKDIALRAGVNPSTVSRALNNHPDVSTDMTEKIKLLAAEMKYVPNSNAIGLRHRSSRIIGLIVPKISMFFIPSVLDGASQLLHSLGYKLLILSSDEQPSKERENILICCNAFVDGILISLCTETTSLEHIEPATEFGIPTVIFDKTLSQQSQLHEIVTDDIATGKHAVEQLLEVNANKILCVMGSAKLDITQQRKVGIDKALSIYKKAKATFVYAHNSEDAYQQVQQALASNSAYDAILAMSDETLLGINLAIAEHEHFTYHNLHVVAISEGVLPSFLHKKIMVCKQDGAYMARKAVDVLLQAIKQEATDAGLGKVYKIGIEEMNSR